VIAAGVTGECQESPAPGWFVDIVDAPIELSSAVIAQWTGNGFLSRHANVGVAYFRHSQARQGLIRGMLLHV